MTTISIVIPCFNMGAFLDEAVQSARSQTRPAEEVMVVDDGSTDQATLVALDRWRDAGVTVLRTENGGAPAARNHGIRHASGEYILCLDADDILHETFLESASPKLADDPAVGIVTSHVELFGDQQGVWETREFDPVALLWRNCIASASLFRRRCWEEVGGYADLPAYQDWSFWISIVARGWRWSVVPRPLYRYRVRRGSISEYGSAHRAELIRTIVDRNRALYEQSIAEIVLGTTGELDHLYQTIASQTATIEELKRLIAQRDETIAGLNDLVREYDAANRRQTRTIEDLKALLRK